MKSYKLYEHLKRKVDYDKELITCLEQEIKEYEEIMQEIREMK